jgi:hypothetical protein
MKARDHMGGLDVYARIILKCTSEEHGVWVWDGLCNPGQGLTVMNPQAL